jgi:hypothetical protein
VYFTCRDFADLIFTLLTHVHVHPRVGCAGPPACRRQPITTPTLAVPPCPSLTSTVTVLTPPQFLYQRS